MKTTWSAAVGVCLLLVLAAGPAWARGFGGFHGGGGGHGGGGFQGGGFSGFHGAPSVSHGMPGGFHGMPSTGMGGGFRGMPGGLAGGTHGSEGGLSGGFGGAGGRFGDPLQGGLGGFHAGQPGARPGDAAGLRGGALGDRAPGGLPGRGTELGRVPSSTDLGRFLGLPSDGGLHAVAGNTAIAGRNVVGNEVNVNRNTALVAGGHNLARVAPDALAARGDWVRQGFYPRDLYSADWYRRYPGLWAPARWAYGDAWAVASWDSLATWLACSNAQAMYYDYGNNVVYQNDAVYVNGQSAGTSDQYYQQAQSLATTGTQTQVADDAQWMSLGVFAMNHDEQAKPTMLVELAVNKDGIIRGNYTNTVADHTLPVHGSVDKQTQRAAWTIGDSPTNVIETGVYNLTKDQAPALVHFGKDRTEQWLLVRLKKDSAASSP